MSLRRVAKLEERLRLNLTRQRRRIYIIERDENTANDQAIKDAGVSLQDGDDVILLIHFGAPITPRLLRVV